MLVALTALLAPAGASAQQNAISVEEFTHDPNELTAMNPKVVDRNNETCALIIVENVDVGGFKFSFKNSWSQAEEKKAGGKRIYYVYVSPGTKGISIANTDGGIAPLNFYSFPQKIEKGKTYHIKLGQVFKSSDTGKQYVQFFVTPPTATVEVEGRPWKVVEGVAEDLLKFGTYNYRVSAPEYHTDAGTVTVNDPKNVQKVEVKLRPNFGWADITGGADLMGADIYIDNVHKGTGAMKEVKLSSGNHTLKVVKKYYDVFELPFSVTDGVSTPLKVDLKTNAATTTFTVGNSAEIWMDGKKLGEGSWRGPLEKGVYIVETKKANHKSKQQRIVIESIDEAHDFTLPEPEPINGELDVTSTPRGATVILDGRNVGVTPLHLASVLIGKHSVKVEQSGYQPYESNVDIVENGTAKVNATLSSTAQVKIHIRGAETSVKIDGTEQSKIKEKASYTSPDYVYNGSVGTSHTLEVKGVNASWGHWRYTNYKKKFTIGPNGNDIFVKLKEYRIRNKTFYWEAGFSCIGMTGADFNMGFYVNGFNLQFDYCLPFANGETMYWHPESASYWSMPEERKATPLPYVLGGRVGWGFNAGPYIRLTPQVGCTYIPVDNPGTYALSGLAALRVFWAFSNHFGIGVTPEYKFRLAEGDLYKRMRELSPKVDKWSNGFNLHITITNFF